MLKPTPLFTTNTPNGIAHRQSDLWLVNGHEDWAYVPWHVAVELGIPIDTPVRLHVGNERDFGAKHIYKKQRRKAIQDLLRRHDSTSRRYETICQHETYAPEYAWMKLNSPGAIYSTESDSKSKIFLAAKPSSLMLLEQRFCHRRQQEYLSIVTLYQVNGHRPDGQKIGRYTSEWINPIIFEKE